MLGLDLRTLGGPDDDRHVTAKLASIAQVQEYGGSAQRVGLLKRPSDGVAEG